MNATWRTLGALCRERGWSKSRAVYELQNGLPYRTFPSGYQIDWRDPNVTRSLNAETGEVVLMRGMVEVEGVHGFNTLTVSLEVLPPSDAEMPLPPAVSSAEWAIATVRELRAEKNPQGRDEGAAGPPA